MNAPRSFAFGPFLLIPECQLLLRDDASVRIGCRALDLLTALVERPGELVTKAELVARAWPSTIVEEANLKVNMSALRRALGDDVGTPNYIATVTGRGYRLIAPVQTNLSPAVPRTPNLPVATTRIFERHEAIIWLVDLSTSNDPVELATAIAPRVAEICRKLDGLALAIELTARALKRSELPDL
jgi:DNA-binding winged helix-turn-helix (wHTH) protein